MINNQSFGRPGRHFYRRWPVSSIVRSVGEHLLLRTPRSRVSKGTGVGSARSRVSAAIGGGAAARAVGLVGWARDPRDGQLASAPRSQGGQMAVLAGLNVENSCRREVLFSDTESVCVCLHVYNVSLCPCLTHSLAFCLPLRACVPLSAGGCDCDLDAFYARAGRSKLSASADACGGKPLEHSCWVMILNPLTLTQTPGTLSSKP